MQLSESFHSSLQVVAATANSVLVNQTTYTQSVIIGNNYVQSIDFKNLNDFNLTNIEGLLDRGIPQLIIFASSDRIFDLNPSVVNYLHKKNIGIEVMQNVAAMRTFNFLVGENRQIICVFLIK